MMQIGLSLQEFGQLRLQPREGADRVFHQVAIKEWQDLFPMTTGAAAIHLRSRGYDCKPQMLEMLVENGVIRLALPDTWEEEDVEGAACYFEEAEIYVPYAAMCQTLGCSYADFLQPLQDAAERETKRFGRAVRDDDQLFVMSCHPPRDDKPALISFTLCDDIRERLERGEEV